MAQQDGMILMLVLMFFAAWTGFTGVLNLMSPSVPDSQRITWDTIGSMGGSIPGQVVYVVSPVSAITQQNYTDAAGYNHNFTVEKQSWLSDFGTWTQGSTGYVLTAKSSPNLFVGARDPVLYLNNVVAINGVYTVSYVIDNVPGESFAIIPRYSPTGAGTNVNQGGLNGYNIRVVFSSDGVHIPNIVDGEADYFFYPMQDAQLTIPGGSEITSDYNPTLNQVTITKDGNILFAVSGIQPINTLVAGPLYYGAVSSNTIGFTVVGTAAAFSSNPTNSGDYNVWSGLATLITGIVPGGQAIVQFFAIIGAAIGLTSDPVIPFAVWAIIGIPQIAFLIYLGLKIARGVS
jgi:hypothetical protein